MKIKNYKGFDVYFEKWIDLNPEHTSYNKQGIRFFVVKHGQPLSKTLFSRFADEDGLYLTEEIAFDSAKEYIDKQIKKGKL